MPKFYTQFDPPPKEGLTFKDPSMTQQQFKTETDINHLIGRYKSSGVFYDPLNPPRGVRRMPLFDDFCSLPDFTEAQQIVVDAQARFADLPASTRKFFDNDPTLLLAFVQDPNNREKAVELGLISAPDPTPVVPAEIPVPATPIPGEIK